MTIQQLAQFWLTGKFLLYPVFGHTVKTHILYPKLRNRGKALSILGGGGVIPPHLWGFLVNNSKTTKNNEMKFATFILHLSDIFYIH